jgi:diacylglycerol kinase
MTYPAEMPLMAPLPLPDSEPTRRRHRLSWRAKFRAAFRGIKVGVRGHSSFFVHFFLSALVVAAAIVLRCEVIDWCILLGCIALVLTAELFNSALETLFRGLDDETKGRTWPSLDVSAGAVLFASIAAAVIGGIVFLQRLVKLLS